MLCVGFRMMTIVHSESSSFSLYFSDISDGVHLLSYTDWRGLYDNLGMCKPFSPHLVAPSLCIEDIDDRWIQFSEYIASVGQICVTPGQCLADYMEWFYMISHPFMSLTQPGDPPRHPACGAWWHICWTRCSLAPGGDSGFGQSTFRCTCWCRPTSTYSGIIYFQLCLLLILSEHALTLNFFHYYQCPKRLVKQ